ncbi:aspartate kinase [Bacillus solimangrovi]|uniref:Aspartokinase n=1 Tax=Bacillus solimangrovi TaxID=1305675 RepID=A0A1E5LK80_9BACI|nr:aspartate kinase [Bacillus solimangrovi]OEH94503.1 aspartate kinase [Bacillus solimangrovi]
MKVSKFGGTSVASAEQFKKVAQIIKDDPERKVVIVSAPGKRFSGDTKTTDLLIEFGEKILRNENVENELLEIINRYDNIATELGINNGVIAEITANLHALRELDRSNNQRVMDRIKASGEDNNAELFAAYMNHLEIEASYVNPQEAGIVVSDEPGNAQVLPETFENLKKLKLRSGVLIIPGFFGYSPDGELVTFSRGGSDITGSIVAAGVGATLYENFTDVDSVFSANPAVVENPRAIEELTYKEMRELSYAGFSVFHDEALIPAFRAEIPVCIKNTNNPSARGTFVVLERNYEKNPIVGIASDSGFCSIHVSKYLMNREVGFGRRLLQILEDEGLSYEHMPSGIDETSVILRERQFNNNDTETRVMERIRSELQVDSVTIKRNQAMIMVVGEGMTHQVGISAKATAAFARADVNIEMINQGSSEVSMMFAVQENDAAEAVRSLYKEYYGENVETDGLIQEVLEIK